MTAKASPNLFGDAPLSNQQILGTVNDKLKQNEASNKTSSLAKELMTQTLENLAKSDKDLKLANQMQERRNPTPQ